MKKILLGCTGAILLIFLAMQSPGAGETNAPNAVTIADFHFTPQTLTVPAGTTVTWINRDDEPHTVTSADKKSFVSPALDTGEKFSFKFAAPGTNDYYCSMHPRMKGKIIVQ